MRTASILRLDDRSLSVRHLAGGNTRLDIIDNNARITASITVDSLWLSHAMEREVIQREVAMATQAAKVPDQESSQHHDNAGERGRLEIASA